MYRLTSIRRRKNDGKEPAVTMTKNSFRRVAYKMHPAALTQRKARALQRFTMRKGTNGEESRRTPPLADVLQCEDE